MHTRIKTSIVYLLVSLWFRPLCALSAVKDTQPPSRLQSGRGLLLTLVSRCTSQCREGQHRGKVAFFLPCDTDPEGVKRVKLVVWVITRFSSLLPPSLPSFLLPSIPRSPPNSPPPSHLNLLLHQQRSTLSSLGE